MAEVYGGADLNIAATSANDASEGCFFNRKKAWRHQVRSSATDGKLYDMYPDYYSNDGPDRLATRAWVVQERYLSRRALHFTELQVFWECDQHAASEIFPAGHSPTAPLDMVHRNFALQKRPLSMTSWPGIVNRYTYATLTRSTDKLVAIGGLAQIIQDNMNDSYVAGLWGSCLEIQLGWCMNYRTTVDRSKKNARIRPYTAPTWSWASMRGEILMMDEITQPKKLDTETLDQLCIQVQNVNVKYVADSNFGEVQEANLRLRCDALLYGSVEYKQWENQKIYFGSSVHAVDVYASFDCVDIDPEGPLISVCILPIREHNASRAGFGLFLERTEKPGEYQRIGFYKNKVAFHMAEMSKTGRITSENSDSNFVRVEVDADGKEEYFIDLV